MEEDELRVYCSVRSESRSLNTPLLKRFVAAVGGGDFPLGLTSKHVSAQVV